MPLPLIARQRAISRVGEIRIGGEKPERGVGRKLETFRLTSQHKDVLERCAGLYGGTLTPWASPNGDAYQLYTEASALPCLVLVDYSLQQVYEKWEGATKCVRRCDGEEEFISGTACICNQQGLEGKAACDIITRLMLVLHETGSSLGWMLRSTGENAARELSGAIMVAEQLAHGRAFVPATLRLTQRRSVIDGTTVRYVVPVLDFNLVAEAKQWELTSVTKSEPFELGYTPVEPKQLAPVTVAEGLAAAAATATPKTTNARSAAPMPKADDIDFGDPVPVPDDNAPVGTTKTGDATVKQTKMLDVLVGKLRDAGQITTQQLYAAISKERNIDADDMMKLIGGRDTEGVLHWAPLRESLTKAEASALIERLSALEEKVTA
jgi:hypothetical protein